MASEQIAGAGFPVLFEKVMAVDGGINPVGQMGYHEGEASGFVVVSAAEVLFQPKIEHDEKIPAAHFANF